MKTVITVAILLMSAALLHAQPFTLPDAREGVIDGRQALLVWPTDANGELTNPSDCNVHLRPTGQAPDAVSAFPCAKWFLPPASGWFTMWVEQGDLISPYQSPIRFGETRGAGSGAITNDILGPAGYVRLTEPVPSDRTLRLVSLTSPSFGFERRLSSAGSGESARFPAGQFLAGIFTSDGNAIAVTRPTELKQGETVLIAPSSPAQGTADLILVVQRADGERTVPHDCRVSLEQGSTIRRPDVLRIAQTRLFAVWYALPPTGGALNVNGERRAVSLAAGEVTTIRTQLGDLRE